ncbi:MAG: G5 domain-containing protein [Clostridia bacterium]|nr:G5 domain-containing protein [Clostridia bacterium]
MIKVNHENKAWIIARAVIAIVLVIMCAMTVVAAASGATYDVTIIDTGRSVTFSTRAETLSHVLREADIETDDNDIVITDDFVPGEPSTIKINRGYNVTVSYHGENFRTVGYKTVANVIEQEKLEVSETDTINYSPDTKLSEGMIIIIENPITVKIKVDGEVIKEETFSADVETVLSRCGVELGEDDIVKPERGTTVKKNTTIKVSRVTYKEVTKTEIAPYGTTYKDTSKMYKGATYVKSKGVNGEKDVVYKMKYVEGKKVDEEVVSEKITEKPVDQVVVRGTKKPAPGYKAASVTVGSKTVKTVSNFKLPAKYTIDENLVPTEYKQKFNGPGTAYHGGYRTSTGKIPEPGYIAVDPDIIPYGSKLWITSDDGRYVYGYAIAADTGGFTWNGSGTLADLYFDSTPECIQFGRRAITIYVLD